MGRLSAAAGDVAARLAVNYGEEVTLTRGASSDTCQAIPINPDVETVDDAGLVVRDDRLDFQIRVAEYVVNDVEVEPERGDIITYNSRYYEVVDDGNIGAWAWGDSHRTWMRVRTKDIGAVS